MKPRNSWFTLLLLAALGLSPDFSPNNLRAYDDISRITVETVDVPMRDGVKLRADLQKPSTGGPFPVLVYRTPYGRKAA
jgi:predicted acyl esterase